MKLTLEEDKAFDEILRTTSLNPLMREYIAKLRQPDPLEIRELALRNVGSEINRVAEKYRGEAETDGLEFVQFKAALQELGASAAQIISDIRQPDPLQQRLVEALEMMYDKWENGTPCYDDPEECSGSFGNAFKLSEAEEREVLSLIPQYAPATHRALRPDPLAEAVVEAARLREALEYLVKACEQWMCIETAIEKAKAALAKEGK